MQQYDQKYNQIAIDMGNLFWRSVTSCAKRASEVEEVFIYTHVILDFLERVKTIQTDFGYSNSTIYFLLDNPKSKINARSLIDEHYKSSRCNESIPKEFWDTLALLEMILECYSDNYIIMRLESCEADDLVCPLVKEKATDKNKLLCVSVDLDWSRALALSENVHWFNFKTLYWHKELFKQEYGFYPERNKVQFYKTIRGDRSDDITASVPNLPNTVLTHILDHYDSITYFIDNFNRDENIPEQWKIKILENRSKILSNYSLVDFIPIDKSVDELSIKCKENTKELRYWYNLLDLPIEYRMKTDEERRKGSLSKQKFKVYKR